MMSRLPLVSDLVIPFEARTTFEDYQINTGRHILSDPPDHQRRRLDPSGPTC